MDLLMLLCALLLIPTGSGFLHCYHDRASLSAGKAPSLVWPDPLAASQAAFTTPGTFILLESDLSDVPQTKFLPLLVWLQFSISASQHVKQDGIGSAAHT